MHAGKKQTPSSIPHIRKPDSVSVLQIPLMIQCKIMLLLDIRGSTQH